MKKSGLADSPLFKPLSQIETTASPSDEKENVGKKESSNRRKPVTPINHATNQPTNHDNMQPRHHATMVETIRSALKEFGKEAATYRLTQEEKKAIEDRIYEYKRNNIKTSANEITRIGINYILQDHKKKGNQSILALVIQALNR